MTHEELLERARERPFVPFRVILTTGDTYDVTHPDLIMVGRRSVVLGIVNQPGRTVYDRSILVDLLHVVGVEELAVRPPSSSNGESQ